MLVLGILIGLVLGIVLTCAVSLDRISQYEEDLHTQIKLRKNREKFIDNLITYNHQLEDKQKDYENNIEILVNNLSAQKKKLVRPDNQD